MQTCIPIRESARNTRVCVCVVEFFETIEFIYIRQMIDLYAMHENEAELGMFITLSTYTHIQSIAPQQGFHLGEAAVRVGGYS